jgi:hypothetical protein
VPLGCTHQFDEDCALAAALPAKAAHGLGVGLAQFLRLVLQGLGRRRAVVRDCLDEAQEVL